MRRLNAGTPLTAETPLKVGDPILIEYYGSWWEGEVLALKSNGDVRIRYTGYGSDWDETVPRSRVRRSTAGAVVGTAAQQHPPGPLRVGPGGNVNAGKPVGPTTPLKTGDRVQIEQYGAWWAGEVLDVLEDGRIKVRYTGWGSGWDEVVPRSRLCLDVPGVWEDLEGKYLRLHLDGQVVLSGTLVERGEDYLLLTTGEGKRLLVNRARLLYTEIDVVP
jgi:hypothetical protein